MTAGPRQAAATAALAWRKTRETGGRAVVERLVRELHGRMVTGGTRLALWAEDIADSGRLELAPAAPVDGPLTVGWMIMPPAAGSGGHTTMFRMVQALEAAGHRCVVYLCDRDQGEIARHVHTIRAGWPGVRAEVRDVHDGVRGVDALVATSWHTAHVLATRSAALPVHRFYFVQDLEPAFYPVGSAHVLAEDTYRFGLHGITAGGWLADELAARHGMACDPFPFGADADVYRWENEGERPGVVFYARPSAARRGYELGVLALELLARRRPEVEIHLFGDQVRGLPFPATGHGKLSTTELNLLYNRCSAGLSLSFTNVSLIPWELLAAGAVPVVNDAHHNRRVLDNAEVVWARSTPQALADALTAVVDDPDPAGRARAASASVAGVTWETAGRVVVAAIERECARRPALTAEREA
jgi:glycosyltransferase involved in cell wall biosynthesis